MNTKAVSAKLSNNDGLLSLNVIGSNDKTSAIDCNKLVLAAGPWTPAMFKMLFPRSSVKFDPVISAGECFVFDNSESYSENSIAGVYFDAIVGHKLEFAGRNDHTIWATGEKIATGEVPDVGRAPQPDPGSLGKLKGYAALYLKRQHPCKQQMRVISQGRAHRPATRTQLPSISAVPACKLSADRCGSAKTGVFVNSGHGSYGVTLGMGSGKLMSLIILNDETDLDISKFTLINRNNSVTLNCYQG